MEADYKYTYLLQNGNSTSHNNKTAKIRQLNCGQPLELPVMSMKKSD